MNTDELIFLGNDYRSKDQYDLALKSYGQAFLEDPNNIHAWNNYGNVLREIGEPLRAIPFLEHAVALNPDFVTAHFNLAIAHLLSGNYKPGWEKYEWRWRYEHLDGTLPQLDKPQWDGQSLEGKTLLIISEQGYGDCIQFFRFVNHVKTTNTKIKFLTMPGLVTLFQDHPALEVVTNDYDLLGDYDYWVPIMSLPKILSITLENLPYNSKYIYTALSNTNKWRDVLGPKKGLRIGICYSGRRDNWVNRYKGVPLEFFTLLTKKFPEAEWINLQVEPVDNEERILKDNHVRCFDGGIQNWYDTAGLIHNLDIVVSIDTSVAHLAGAMGVPTFIPLTKFAVDWRWGIKSNLTPWYPTVRLFRQKEFGNWSEVFNDIEKYIKMFKL